MRWDRITLSPRQALLCVSVFFAGGDLQAQELEPRTYAQTPVGVHFIAAGYGLSAGNVLMDPALRIEGLDANLDLIFLRYTRSFALVGRSAKLRVVASTGAYESDKLLNLGSNRWTIKPEAGFSRAIRNWTFEGAASAWFFTDNDDFFGGNRLSQRALHILKSHVIYTFRPGFFTALGVGWGNGGQTFVNGEPRQKLTPAQELLVGLGSAVHAEGGRGLRHHLDRLPVRLGRPWMKRNDTLGNPQELPTRSDVMKIDLWRRVRALAIALLLAIGLPGLVIGQGAESQVDETEADAGDEAVEGISDADRETMALDSTATQWSFQFAWQVMPDYHEDVLPNGETRKPGNTDYLQLRIVAPIPLKGFTILPRLTLRHYENRLRDSRDSATPRSSV